MNSNDEQKIFICIQSDYPKLVSFDSRFSWLRTGVERKLKNTAQLLRVSYGCRKVFKTLSRSCELEALGTSML